MREIRNSNGHLVCRINKRTGAVEIRDKGCITLIERRSNGNIVITNITKK